MPKPVGGGGQTQKLQHKQQHGKEDKQKKHPHGGPPGQMKKELGLKTGKEAIEMMKKIAEQQQQQQAGGQQQNKLNLMA